MKVMQPREYFLFITPEQKRDLLALCFEEIPIEEVCKEIIRSYSIPNIDEIHAHCDIALEEDHQRDQPDPREDR